MPQRLPASAIDVQICSKVSGTHGDQVYPNGWPKHDLEKCPKARRTTLRNALVDRYDEESFLVAYEPTSLGVRLTKGVVTSAGALERIGGCVTMTLFLADVDCHQPGANVNAWFELERLKLRALNRAHPGIVAYRSRNGYRIVAILASRFEIRTQQDEETWSRLTLAWGAYLARRFDINIDPLKDWTRFQRVPHDTRAGSEEPEDLEVIGDVDFIAVWDPELSAEDWKVADTKPEKPTKPEGRSEERESRKAGSPTLLRCLLQSRGLLGRFDGVKWNVICPKESDHGAPDHRNKGSDTVLYEGDGQTGLIHCMHSNCGHDRMRHPKDWIDCFTQSEIDSARSACGIEPMQRKRKGNRTPMADSRKNETKETAEREESEQDSPPVVLPLKTDMTTQMIESWWLPKPARDWVDAISAAFAVPKIMPIAAALCAASAMVQGRCKVKINEDWIEPLNLFWIVFAPTGCGKSLVMKEAMQPILEMEKVQTEELENTIYLRTNERERLKAQITRMRRVVKAHKYSEGAQEHLQQLRELEAELKDCVVPKIPSEIDMDINPPVIPRVMLQNQEATGIAKITIMDSEGSFIHNMLGRYSNKVHAEPMLKGYGGERLTVKRTMQGTSDLLDVKIDHAHMVICSMVQPHILDLLRGHPELTVNGWLGRCLMSPVTRQLAPTPFDRPRIPAGVREGYARWLMALRALPVGTTYEMSRETYEQMGQWHVDIEADIGDSEAAVGWQKRTLGRLCRIIALVSLAEQSTENLSAESAESAEFSAEPAISAVQLNNIEVLERVSVRTEEITPGICSATRARDSGEMIILTYLYNSLYLQNLEAAKAIEPAMLALSNTTRRVLRRFRRSGIRVGDVVSLSSIYNGLKIPKDEALRACDALMDSGHLEIVSEFRRGTRPLTVKYKVVCLDEKGTI